MNIINIDFNEILSEIFAFFNQLLSQIVISYTTRNGHDYTTTFLNLFICAILLDKILSVFFAKYNDYDHNQMDDDDLYDE